MKYAMERKSKMRVLVDTNILFSAFQTSAGIIVYCR